MRLALTCIAVAALAVAEGPLEVRPGGKVPHDGPGDAVPSMLRASVNWIRVPVHVTDGSGAPYAGLARPDFVLTEDGLPQEIRRLSEEETPVSIAIVFDASSSMKDKLNESRAAIAQLFQHALPEDEYALIEFGNEPAIREPFTREPSDIERAAARIQLSTWTALYDAVYLGVSEARHASNPRRALVVLSDGADNNSRYSASELRSYIQEAEVPVYSIAIRSSASHAAALKKLADSTGGLSLAVNNVNDLAGAVAQLSRVLRNQYVLDYVSNQVSRGRDGHYRRVDVRLSPSAAARGLHLAWRHGYFEPQTF